MDAENILKYRNLNAPQCFSETKSALVLNVKQQL